MSRIHLLTCCLLLLTLLGVSTGQQLAISARVVGVHDGDTITVLTPIYTKLKIRLAFIDAPELSQPFGYRAKQAMSMLVYGRDVTLRTHSHDRYGRTVAIVFIEETDVGLQLLRQGLAWPYYHYLSEAAPEVQTSYLAAAEDARAARIGLWRDSEPMAPWLFRHSHVLTIDY